MSASISAIVIARNEEKMIGQCLNTLRWCDELIVINNGSSDSTVGIAHKFGAKVFSLEGGFAELRNEGWKRAKTDWVFYVDADERVTPALAAEIKKVISAEQNEGSHAAYGVSRANVMYGTHMTHGGWEKDTVIRLFKSSQLLGWSGSIHEHADVMGTTGVLEQQLVHFTHRNTIDGLKKTIEWTPLEAQQLAEANIGLVSTFTILRKGVMEILRRAVMKQGYKDGMLGWVEAIIQGINRALVYIQTWELQQRPSIEDQYAEHEQEITKLWQRHYSK
jgi:glycosyltransferase involved in cell wall biosynthesis